MLVAHQHLTLRLKLHTGMQYKGDYSFLLLKEKNNRTSSQRRCHEKLMLVTKSYLLFKHSSKKNKLTIIRPLHQGSAPGKATAKSGQ
jgi:hypothetical protein